MSDLPFGIWRRKIRDEVTLDVELVDYRERTGVSKTEWRYGCRYIPNRNEWVYPHIMYFSREYFLQQFRYEAPDTFEQDGIE